MRKWLLATLPLAILPFVLDRASGGDEKTLKKLTDLEGTWTISKMEISGNSLLEKGEKWKLVIKDGKVTSDAKAAPKEAKELAKFLDPGKKPKTITLPTEGNVVFYGIYEVKGDELRVCGEGVDTSQEKEAEGRRPTEFDSGMGLLLVFKRDKK